MPRKRSCWPSVLCLHCTGRSRNSWNRNLWTSYPDAVRQACNRRPCCNSFFQHMLWQNSSRFCHPFLLLFWLSRSCFGAKHMPYCFQEHSHPNSLVNFIGSTWWRVLQTKAEDHYYMSVLGSRVRLKGRCYEVSCKTNRIFFISASMTEIPPKVAWFLAFLSWPYIRTVSRRDRREVRSNITLKKEVKTFSDN